MQLQTEKCHLNKYAEALKPIKCETCMLVVIRLCVTCSMHVTHANRVYTVNTAAENTMKHPSINNAYVSQRSDIRAR
jgi:hypothetical protein